MGGKYIISLEEERVFPKNTYPTTDYYLNNIFEVIMLVIKKRKKIRILLNKTVQSKSQIVILNSPSGVWGIPRSPISHFNFFLAGVFLFVLEYFFGFGYCFTCRSI